MSAHGKWRLVAVLFLGLVVLGAAGWWQLTLQPSVNIVTTTPKTIASASSTTKLGTVTSDTKERYLALLRSLKDEKFAAYAETHRLCIEDNKLSDLEIRFLNNPEQYGKDLLSSYIEEAERNATYSELGKELRKIPEVKAALDKTNVTMTESVEDIVYSVLMSRGPTIGRTLDRMLNEGIKEKRKYCTPLQALLWNNIDKEPDSYDPLTLNYANLRLFVQFVWRVSSMSRYYKSEQWKSFDDVVDRLNSRDMISAYMEDQLPWGYSESAAHGYWWKCPEETFKDKCGHCYDLSAFALHCLANNGYTNAKILFVRCGQLNEDSSGNGHAVVVQDEGTRFYTIDNGLIRGPYSKIDEVIVSASDKTKTKKALACRFFLYGQIPYHTPYGDIYYGVVGWVS